MSTENDNNATWVNEQFLKQSLFDATEMFMKNIEYFWLNPVHKSGFSLEN